jgi:hypothetical protein
MRAVPALEIIRVVARGDCRNDVRSARKSGGVLPCRPPRWAAQIIAGGAAGAANICVTRGHVSERGHWPNTVAQLAPGATSFRNIVGYFSVLDWRLIGATSPVFFRSAGNLNLQRPNPRC